VNPAPQTHGDDLTPTAGEPEPLPQGPPREAIPLLPPALARLLRRFGSPSALLLALLLFPLPWVEIQCGSRSSPGPPPPGAKPNPVEILYNLIPWREAVTPFTQSGWQAVEGTCTVNPELNDPEKGRREMNEAMSGSLPLAAYPFVLFVGILAGLRMPCDRRRRLVVGLCAAAVLGLLLWQVAVGFPLDTGMRKLFAEDLEKQAQGNTKEGVIYITYTPWFVLAVLSVAGALFLSAAEEWHARRRRRAAERPAAEPEPVSRSP
jgi:hypothetical protein